MKKIFSFKKLICGLLVFSVAFTQILPSQTAYAADVTPAGHPNDPKTVYDLVVLVVDITLDRDNTSYFGLRDNGFDDELSETKLGHRIIRYAEDLKENNTLTDVKILYFDKEKDTVVDIANALENLYINGDYTHNNRLSGAVFIGDIPLPVVNKNGNRYVSLFPYTDFSDKVYIYNPDSLSYEIDNSVSFPKPEIWHGIIKAPTDDSLGKEKLAEFFDKNHLYYEGNPMFAEFDRKMFFGDLIHEEEQINEDIYKKYVQYLNAFEDLAYFRYNKFWASELTKGAIENLPFNEDNPLNQPTEDGTPGFAQTLQSENPLVNLPDIYSKQIIDQFLPPYFKIFGKYISKVNDWADYTGRYKASTQVHSVPALITIKDEYTKFYLKSVNDALEKKLNEVVEKIEEPLPILDYSVVSGEYDDNSFKIFLDDADGEEIYFRFNYKNEADGTYYINGSEARILESAKQCAPYLGSTKSEYFDEDKNFNPKAVNGNYSILTRAMRSDDISTAVPLITSGVNTRILSPEELVNETNGVYAGNVNPNGIYETGAIIEDNPEYGISAFIDNPFYSADDDYKGPFENKLEPGDVIVSVNGKNLSYAYTFDQAIKSSYDYVLKVIDAINTHLPDKLSDYEYPIAIENPPLLARTLDQLRPHIINFDVEIDIINAIISVDYYRRGIKHTETFSFSVKTDDKFTRRDDPTGTPNAIVILSTEGFPGDVAEYDFDQNSEGALFTLYENNELGYDNNAYDDSGGCNAYSTYQNSDRCLAFVSTMPVLDPAGALAPVKTEVPGYGDYVLFPEKVKSEGMENSPYRADYEKHVYQFQFPQGYSYEDVDELYYNACYSTLPTPYELNNDYNYYGFVLDKETGPRTGADIPDRPFIHIDFYGRLLNSIGEFIKSWEADEPDYCDSENCDEDDMRAYSPKEEIWQNLNKITPDQVLLCDESSRRAAPRVTLSDFTKRYGLFDGIDNNSNSITDYEWRDADHDGIYEQKFVDYDEADSRYGISDAPLSEIARKMLSHETTYTIPYGSSSFPYDDFDDTLDLEISPHQFEGKTVSSMIIHNEPTDYTVSQQLKSQATLSLPIDNPRYVAFQTIPWQGPDIPKRIAPGINTEPHYAPGQIKKVEYLNLFAEDIANLAQMQSKLAQKANELALIPGSYKIFGPAALSEDYTTLEISNKILNDYLKPAITSTLDDPLDGFDLTAASTQKIYDALKWKTLNIDDKHEYILKYYLNGGEDTNAYVNDATLFPAPAGFEHSYGYEAAYLVLDGQKDYFDMSFNKNLPEESDPNFDPLAQYLATGEGGESAEEEEEEGDDFEFVWLTEFLSELMEFAGSFMREPTWAQSCGYLPDSGDGESVIASLPLRMLRIIAEPAVLIANGTDRCTVSVTGLDENENLVDKKSNEEVVTLNITQNNSKPALEIADNKTNTLTDGKVDFVLGATENTGTANISARTNSGISSNTIQLATTGNYLKLYSYTYSEIVRADEQEAAELDSSGVFDVDQAGDQVGENFIGEEIEAGEEEISGGISRGTEAEFLKETSETGSSNEKADTKLNRTISEEKNRLDTAKLKEILNKTLGSPKDSDISGGISQSGAIAVDDQNAAEDEAGDEAGGEAGAGSGTRDENDITILKSKPVEKSGEITSGSSGEPTTKTEVEKAEEKAEELEDFEKIKWEEYYVLDEYYKKYLEENSEEKEGAAYLLTEIYSDRMTAYIPDNENPFIDAQKEDSTYFVENNDNFVADGKSLMKIEAQVFNVDGTINTGRRKIKFSTKDISVGSNNVAAFENGDTVYSENGSAIVYLRAGTKTGKFKIIAQVIKENGGIDATYPPIEKELYLTAGEPVFIEINADSSTLAANNQSKTKIEFVLKDHFGNIANNSFSQIAVFTSGEIEIDPKADTNSGIIGTQLSTFEGKASVDVFAKDKTGTADIIAVLMDYDLEELFLEAGDDWEEIDFSDRVGNSREIQIVDNVNLIFNLQNSRFDDSISVPADGISIARIGVKLVHNGAVIEGYNGPINLEILNKNYGDFAKNPPQKMSHGQLNPANITFRPTTLAGEVEILVDIPGFVSDTFKFNTTPGTPQKIELISSADSIYTNGANEAIVHARILDEYGNLVDTNNRTIVRFSATDSTNDFVEFSPANSLTLNGTASTTVLGNERSGEVHIIARTEIAGVKDGFLTLKINKHITPDIAKTFSPRALYISLLGGNFGDLTIQNNLAEIFLNNGQSQAVSAVTADPNDKKRLISIDGYGKIDVLSETITTNVVKATDSFPYQKIVFADNVANTELANVFLVPKNNTPLVLLNDEEATGGEEAINDSEGIYVKRLSKTNETIEFKEENDGIYIEQNGRKKAKIDKFGRISLNDDSLKLRRPIKEDEIKENYFSIIISSNEDALALVAFNQKFNQDVKKLAYNNKSAAFQPGIYFQPKTSSKKYDTISSFSRISTNEPKGFYFIDTENFIDANSAPGFEEDFGFGFDGDNKHMLLFSAGNSVGESLIPYASDTTIIFGDPMIRLKIDEDLISDASGYTKDLGKVIFSGQEEIKEMIDFDFNGDGSDDVLLAYESGLIRLLENEISNKRFSDRGYILNISNGITNISKIDINNDGYDDLIVGTKESCNAGEECVTQIINNNGRFERTSLNLDLNDKKALEMKSGDMNADGCEDLVVSDSSGQINIYYNQPSGHSGDACRGLNMKHGFVKRFGFSLNPDANLVDNIFINYSGMEAPDNNPDDEESNSYKFAQFVLQSDAPSEEAISAGFAGNAMDFQSSILNNTEIATSDIPPQTFPVQYNFIHIKEDERFGSNSGKEAIDLNAGSVSMGDQINYVISLKNNSGRNIRNLMLSDMTPGSMTLLLDSLECLDAGCSDDLKWMETGMSLRSHIISGISVPANGQRIIKYSMKVDSVPEVRFDIGNDFTEYPSNNNDDYLDILVKPDVNPDSVLTYLYSTGLDSKGYVNYQEMRVIPTEEGAENLLENTFAEQGLPSPTKMLNQDTEDEIDPDLASGIGDIMAKQNQDSDYDGCPDLWDSVSVSGSVSGSSSDAASMIAGGLEAAINRLRCSGGGCAPIPYNKAFLAADGMIPGLPLLSLFPPLRFFGIFTPSTDPSSFFRFYLSPTLTMGLGMAACAGYGGSISPASACYAFAIPGGIPGVCSLINGGLNGINKAIAKAKNSLIDPASGQSAIISDGETTGTTDETVLAGSMGDPDDPISAQAKVNIRIPGFPSVITNWLDKETDEIYTKLLDLPTFYLILPNIVPFIMDNIKGASNVNIGGEVGWQSFNDFANSLSSIPLINIEGKEIVVNVPAISAKEIYKYKEQGRKWVAHMRAELQRFTDVNCSLANSEPDPERRNICDKILLDVNELIHSVEKLLDLVDRIANLPREILNWRYLEAKYATQIICYLDAVMNFVGGYISRQTRIIESWMRAVSEVIRAFQSWKMVLDLILEYQQSCDRCKNDRFSKLGLLLRVFAAIPEPPVIPLPKWPDIIVDLSQIKTGVHIVWPDVVFRPMPILLPDIPTINLPDLIPGLTIHIPGFEVPDIPDFILPNLPDLPPLPLPQLPDLPRPPRIPSLPGLVADLLVNLKPIFKILCLLKNGLIPVPEAFLATEIETLTQPNIQAVLPIIRNLAVQIPPIQYDFIKELRITGKLRFDLDASVVYDAVKRGSDIWNNKVREIVREINKYTQLPYGQIISNAIQKAVDKAKEAAVQSISEAVTEGVESVGGGVVGGAVEIEEGLEGGNESSLPLSYNLEKLEENIQGFGTSINKFISENSAEDQNVPETHYLTAVQTILDPSDPMLNKPLSEIENEIELENIPNFKQLAELRNELIAYANGLENGNKLLEKIDDYSDFTKALVENDQSLKRIASLSVPLSVPALTKDRNGAQTKEFNFFGEGNSEIVNEAGQQIKEKQSLLAAAIDFDPADVVNEEAPPAAPPLGFYIVSDAVNENVLSYTAELKEKTNVLFNDIDNDSDYDILFSMGGDVYLKENHKTESRLPQGSVIIGFTNNSISDYVNPGGPRINGVSSPYVNNNKADISWKGVNDAIAYEITLRASLNDSYSNFAYKYIALPKPLTSLESLDDYNISLPDEFVINLSNKTNPSVSLEITNGNYYTSIIAINESGERSLVSDFTMTAPQSCADKEPPLPAVSATEYNISIMKELEIDTSNSFDTEGKVIEYYIEPLPYESAKSDSKSGEPLKSTLFPRYLWSDNNTSFDSDFDSNPTNDKSNPVFRLGPFVNEGDIGKHDFILHIVDQSGNSSSQNFSVNVSAPTITLDETFSRTLIASGETNPSTPNLQFSLMRNRFIYRIIDGELKLIPRTNQIRNANTDNNGEYNISDFNLEDMILVENAEGQIIAEINPITGNIGALADGYNTITHESEFPLSPTRIDIVNEKGDVFGTVYLVTDINIDASIFEEFGFNSENYLNLSGVNVDDTNSTDIYEFISIPASDTAHPGGALLINKTDETRLAIIDTGGNIYLLDPNLSLVKKQNDHVNDPLILELRLNSAVIAEIYISTNSSQIVGPRDVPFAIPRSPSIPTLYGSFDIDPVFDDLYKKDIIREEFSSDQMVKRKDFVKILLKMLCVIPREDAYKPFSAGTGYFDLPYSNDDEFAYIKEGTLLKWIEGYKGEADSAGLLPFKAENTITRAEAVKIILKALEMRDILDLSNLYEGNTWYIPLIEAAQNLNPYFKSGVIIQNNYIITPEEAEDPNKEMTYEELLIMVNRVLDIYSCFEIDNDKDSMSDFCETKYGIDDPNTDQDTDNLINKDECYYGLDPFDPDTDKGGVNDGKEIELKTNPLYQLDDPKDTDNDGLTDIAETLVHHTDPFDPDTDDGSVNDGDEVVNLTNPLFPDDDQDKYKYFESDEGIYIVPADCNSCPCISTFLHKADIIAGDIFFPIISVSYDNYYENAPREKTYIFSKGNEVIIEPVKE